MKLNFLPTKHYDPLIAAGVAAAANLIGNIMNNNSQKEQNFRNQQQAEMFYNWQRRDTLSDWHRVNDYNHPSAQMARLRSAGLNPNLVYGNGVKTEANAIKNPTADAPKLQAPQVDLSGIGDAVGTYYNTRVQEAQTDNLRTQNTVLANEALLKDAQRLNTNAATLKLAQDTKSGAFDLDLKSELRSNSLEAARIANQNALKQGRKLDVDTDFTINQDARAAAMQSSNLAEAAERIAKSEAERKNLKLSREEIRSRIRNMDLDSKLKELDAQLAAMGIRPNDPFYARLAVKAADILLGKTSSEKLNDQKIKNYEDQIRRNPKAPQWYHEPSWLKKKK